MSIEVEGGRALIVEDDSDRIGAGPWARWLASAVVPDESSARAERGRSLARDGAVDSVSRRSRDDRRSRHRLDRQHLRRHDRHGADSAQRVAGGDPSRAQPALACRRGRGPGAVGSPGAPPRDRARRRARAAARRRSAHVYLSGRCRGMQARLRRCVRGRGRDRPRSRALPSLARLRADRAARSRREGSLGGRRASGAEARATASRRRGAQATRTERHPGGRHRYRGCADARVRGIRSHARRHGMSAA